MTDLPSPRIQEAPRRLLVGVADAFDMETRGEIPALYQRFFALSEQIDGKLNDTLYGVSMDARPDGTFRYGVGVEAASEAPPPEGACWLELSAGLYAVFSLRSPMSELPRYFDAVFATWLPGSGFVPREGAVFERYPPDPDNTPTVMRYEIWVPVAAKA